MATHKIDGTIGECEVTITVEGPESQEMADGIGSDIIAIECGEKIGSVKTELEDADTEPGPAENVEDN